MGRGTRPPQDGVDRAEPLDARGDQLLGVVEDLDRADAATAATAPTASYRSTTASSGPGSVPPAPSC